MAAHKNGIIWVKPLFGALLVLSLLLILRFSFIAERMPAETLNPGTGVMVRGWGVWMVWGG